MVKVMVKHPSSKLRGVFQAPTDPTHRRLLLPVAGSEKHEKALWLN